MTLNLIDIADSIDHALSDLREYRKALNDLEELVDDYVDVTANGGPNLAMQVQHIVRIALGKLP